MTGTAKTEEEEFRNIYNMYVITIPTNRPVQRIDMPDLIYANKNAKYNAIVKEIEEGIKKTKGKYEVIVDRVEAIEHAIKMANKRDIIILAGKGHEPYQEINGVKHPFDERIIVRDIIEKMGK